jgi:heat shock protein 1/8
MNLPQQVITKIYFLALSYGLDSNNKKEKIILIFDLGGGTFDVSLLCIIFLKI